jgi:hypothetical protein
MNFEESIKNHCTRMKVTRTFAAIACLLTSSLFALPPATDGFHGKGFEVIAPLLGKIWLGEDENAAGERTVSIEQWEWILGGKAARIMASVNNGELAYQLTFYIDPDTHVLSFHGVSTDNAYTKGTVEVADRKMIWTEKIVGSPFLDLVKLTFTLLPDEQMKSSSEYFKAKKSIPGGHDFHYHVDPNAKLIFASGAK